MRKKKSAKASPPLTPKPLPSVREKLSITIEPNVLAWIDERAENRSEQINHDLARYYRLLAEARTSLRALLSPAELSAITDVQNGHRYADKLYADEIWANVEDGCRLDGLDNKWQIDGPALVIKLKALDLWQVHALADATVRFWHAVGEGDHTREPAKALD